MTSIRKSSPLSPLPGATSIGGEAEALERYSSAVATNRGDETPQPTPTRNTLLPFRRGGFRTVIEALEYAARGETGLNFHDSRGKLLHRLPYADLQVQAERFGRRLVSAGIGRGERLVIVADTWPGFCVAFFGAQYAGVLPVPVAVPVGLGARDGYVAQLRRQIITSGAMAVVAPDELVAFARSAADGTWARLVGGLADFDRFPPSDKPLQPLGFDERCYIQYSSGSTRAPLGVDIRQDRLMANIDGSIGRQELNETDAGVSWLPLYHDMGLIGFVLAPMCAQRSVDLMSPSDFARRPLQWLSMISRRRATITYSPSFGYELASRRAQAKPPADLDLSCLDLAGIGADMIRPDVLRHFTETFAACGFDGRAFMPSYGMAEVCVGLSFSRRRAGFRTATLEGREFVSCGQVMDGHEVQVRGESGLALTDLRVGRIHARGPSVMPGYYLDSDATRQVLDHGWLDTGDLGFKDGEELVVTGRAKDLIIVNGRNIWPQDIEWAIEELPRLRRGDACAFSIDQGQGDRVVVLVQAYPATPEEHEALAASIGQVVRETAGVDCRVVLVSRAVGLPLTSSGKLSRTRAKTIYLAGKLVPA